MENSNTKNKTKKENTELYVQLGIIAVLALVIVFNFGRVYAGSKSNEISSNEVSTGIGLVSASNIIPKGTPAVYGAELGVKYDYITPNNPQLTQDTISKLSQYEDIELNKEQMSRYLKIGGSIACEYCCGAKSLIFSNGERACGCAHSYAMRGLSKYLLTKHPEMADEEILSELGKWKVLFFPGIHEQKAKVLEANGIDSTNYINLASNLYRGIETGQSSGGGQMVGGC